MAEDGKLRVGVAQIDCRLADLDHNAATHLRMIERARRERIELLLFPELSLTGYAVGPQTAEISIRRDAALLSDLAGASADMVTVLGFIEEGVAAQFHNSAVALRNGEVTFIHRKLNLATYGNLEEGKHFAEGRYFETFPLDRCWRAGVLICADSWNPALTHLAMVHGTTLLMVPIASAENAVDGTFSNPRGWDLAMQFYAMIYGVPILMANHARGQSGPDFWGGSRIVDPFGQTLAAAQEGEDLLIADLDYEAVKRARYRLPTLRDSNLDLVLRELNRLSWQIGIPEESRTV
ncbi:nitrilase-related carbon-nitrogen hydrolase [Algihabitans albus]|uniref:nitrilase-related carbon-nitrogen hydrolase n=1 Tax=Algihabitans albus TaxID=2164067 RepID=UPI000E5CE3EA|nr:nitrilase-related carbon-nitrogen hydrolase [Algihabitans albus]